MHVCCACIVGVFLLFMYMFVIIKVAEDLMIMYGECLEGNFSSVERLREASRNPAAYSGVQKVS